MIIIIIMRAAQKLLHRGQWPESRPRRGGLEKQKIWASRIRQESGLSGFPACVVLWPWNGRYFSDGEPPRPHLAAPVAGHSTRARGAGEAAALPGELRRSQPFLRLAARYFGDLEAESSESP